MNKYIQMKRIFLAIAMIAIFITAAHAQSDMIASITNNGSANTQQEDQKVKKSIRFSIGADIGVPTGYLADHSSLAVGGSLQAEYPLTKVLTITANAGYLDFIAKRGGKNLPFIPVLGGLKYDLTPMFYVSGQAGISFYGGRDKNDGNGGGSGEKYLTYVPGLGIRTSKQFDILLKYETVYIGSSSRSYAFAGARIAYNFNLK